jgi:hypothetical protein
VRIIDGSLQVDPTDRAALLAADAEVVPLARSAPGCLDVVQATDPQDAGRVNAFERGEGEDHLLACRGAGRPAAGSSPIRPADIRR